VEAARALGEQMTRTADVKKAISDTFKKLTGRMPSHEEISLLAELQKRQLGNFQQHPEKARGWLTTGQHIIAKDLDPLLVAANAVVASTILNADATLTRR